MGELLLREPSWEYSSNCDEAIFGVQKASLNMFWGHSPYLTNIASDWLRAELSWDEEEEKEKKWTAVSLRKEFVYLLTCGRRSFVSVTQNKTVIS